MQDQKATHAVVSILDVDERMITALSMSKSDVYVPLYGWYGDFADFGKLIIPIDCTNPLRHSENGNVRINCSVLQCATYIFIGNTNSPVEMFCDLIDKSDIQKHITRQFNRKTII